MNIKYELENEKYSIKISGEWIGTNHSRFGLVNCFRIKKRQ